MKMKHIAYAVSLIGFAAAGIAHAAEQKVDKIEITGSSIKRIAKEGALPVQTLKREDIVKSGATTVAELMQKLPAMQGFSVTTTAVGTNSGGISTASIHDIGEEYTLVLLNGRRLAPSGSGGRVNLNSIPMSAIERVEVLTDGASALYGSDAIAGVVNFVLKRNAQGGTADARIDRPQESGGETWNASASYGFGDLDTDGFNVLFAYRHDAQKKLLATDRDFAKSAFIRFNHEGKEYFYNRGAPHSIPANPGISIAKGVLKDSFGADVTFLAFNPYLQANGKCADRSALFELNDFDKQCYFDFASTLEIFPESKRDSFFGSFNAKVGTARVYGEAALGRFDLTAVIAPNAVNVPIAKTSAFYKNHVEPYLAGFTGGKVKSSDVTSVTAQYRMYDFGGRASQSITDSKHFVLGGEIDVNDWNIHGGLTWSENTVSESYIGGYSKRVETTDLINSGALNPFLPIGQQSAETKAKIQSALFNGKIRDETTELRGADIRASGALFDLSGGSAMLGLGADYRVYHYSQTPTSAGAVGGATGVIYAFSALPKFDLERSTYGVFSELMLPLTKDLELTAGVRYDNFSAVDDLDNKKTVGLENDATTYKVAARYQPTRNILLRASYGTGFKAPSQLEIARPLTPSGVTSNPYTCPFPGTEFCKGGRAQYQRLTVGNDKLKPEKSTQYTVGFRLEPTPSFSMGMDYWSVEMKDQVSNVSEAQAFGDPATYKDLFTTFVDPSDNKTYWAFKLASINIGQAQNKGIDWDFTHRAKFGGNVLTTSMNGTYLIKSAYTRPGTADQWETSLGKFGINNAVSFRNIAKLASTLQTGQWSNTLTVNFRSGYADMTRTDVIDVAATAATKKTVTKTMTLQVPSYTTVDWQGSYDWDKSLNIRAGVKNLLNRQPPLSLRTGGSHHVGYDPRYTDSFLRTFYLSGSYKF